MNQRRQRLTLSTIIKKPLFTKKSISDRQLDELDEEKE